MDLQKNKDQVFAEVANAIRTANRPENSVSIVAVTKYVDSSTAKELIKTGISHIGENRVDKFLEKYQELKDEGLTWHLIGTLQRRKVKDIINYVDYFHALDSVKLAEEINKRATHIVKCFLQVNVSGEESKHGFAIEEVEAALKSLENLERIKIVGIMTMAPIDASEDELKNIFQTTHNLQQKLQSKQIVNMPFSDISMGMSQDYALAIQHGSTFVRIGSSFFK